MVETFFLKVPAFNCFASNHKQNMALLNSRYNLPASPTPRPGACWSVGYLPPSYPLGQQDSPSRQPAKKYCQKKELDKKVKIGNVT